MVTITLVQVNADNWRDTLHLSVYPEQQRFVADYSPIAAVALAKAFVRPGGMLWIPYAIYKVFIQLVRENYALCREIRLTVHPDNTLAQQLYTHLGFQQTGEESYGEPVYTLYISHR